MTKKTFFRTVSTIIAVLILLVILGICLSIFDSSADKVIYTTFKDVIPLCIAILASFLTYSFQKRLSFLQYMRGLWTQTVDAIQTVIQYTHGIDTTQKNYGNTLYKLSVVIDEVRGAFKNINESKCDGGLYPFEPIKEIFTLVTEINYGENFNSELSKEKRSQIFLLWQSMRKEFLKEFDRDCPTFGHSHWVDDEKLTITKGRPSTI